LQNRTLRVDIMTLPLLRLLARQTGRRVRGGNGGIGRARAFSAQSLHEPDRPR
jgi:hypothetical protein